MKDAVLIIGLLLLLIGGMFLCSPAVEHFVNSIQPYQGQ